MLRSIQLSGLLLLVLASSIFSQSLSIQGVARDNTGQSLADGSYGFTFRLYLVETAGSQEWTEDQTLSVLNGVFSTILGDVTSMASLDFDQEYWLSLEIDNNGELSPRTKLILSPYAIMAEQTGQDNVFPLSGKVGIGTPTPSHMLTVEGAINASGSVGNIDIAAGTGQVMEAGNTNLTTLRFDANGYRIYAGGTGGAGTIVTAKQNGNVGIGTTTPHTRLHVNGGTDVSLTGGGYITSGQVTGLNIAMDNNEIMARSNGAPATLYLNNDGGTVQVGGDIKTRVGTSSVFDKPFQFRKYYATGENAYINTGFKESEYIAAITGFDAGVGDLDETGNKDLWQINAYVSNGIWWIFCDAPTHGNLPEWDIYVMFVSTKFGYATAGYKAN